VHQQHRALLAGHGQLLEKAALRGAELLMGPGGRAVAHGAVRFGWRDRHVVVVALDQQGALLGQGHRPIHHGAGIGAVTHQIAQQGEALCAVAAGVSHAGVQRLEVGMDIRQQGPLHLIIVLMASPPSCTS